MRDDHQSPLSRQLLQPAPESSERTEFEFTAMPLTLEEGLAYPCLILVVKDDREQGVIYEA